MTRVEDIIQQIETLKADNRYPPTLIQEEIARIILHRIRAGMADFNGRF